MGVKNVKTLKILGLMGLLIFVCLVLSISTGSLNVNSSNSMNKANLAVDPTLSDNDSGCASVIVHVKPGLDVVSYRRDSNDSADTIIQEMNISNQKAVREYKTQGGNFTHIIITDGGWIICIGGKDDPDLNNELIKLAGDVISRGSIQMDDVYKANRILKQDRWGHFMIKSPDNNVGVTAYDSRNKADPSNMTTMLKLNDGDYVKITNNPNYYTRGPFNGFSSDHVDAAVRIVGQDTYGLDRRDLTTYELTYSNNTTSVNAWASFDGGAMVSGAHGYPDNVIFNGNKVKAGDLPKIPDKKYLGEEVLKNKTTNSTIPTSSNLMIAVLIVGLGASGLLLFRFTR